MLIKNALIVTMDKQEIIKKTELAKEELLRRK